MKKESENFLVALVLSSSLFAGAGLIVEGKEAKSAETITPKQQKEESVNAGGVAQAQLPKLYFSLPTYGYFYGDVRKLLIKNAQIFYTAYIGPCPCPYHTDQWGTPCGGRSAWSRAQGVKPICYLSEISSEAAQSYKNLLDAVASETVPERP